jgi:hypothetical protein
MANMNTIVAIMVVLATSAMICQAYLQSKFLELRRKRQLASCTNNLANTASNLVSCATSALNGISGTNAASASVDDILSAANNVLTCIAGGSTTTANGALFCVVSIVSAANGIASNTCSTGLGLG